MEIQREPDRERVRVSSAGACHTWLVGHSRGEEESLLGGGSRCQSALVVWKNGDHERRHVTLDLLKTEREEIRHPTNAC